MDINDEVKNREELLILLRDHKLVLMAGAGTSFSVGYPLWPNLLEELRQTLRVTEPRGSSESLIDFADRLKSFAESHNLRDDYYLFLQDTFKPRQEKSHTQFHRTLVNLGFKAITTTNYDEVLEHAINASRNSGDKSGRVCKALNLCDPHPSQVLPYLRELGVEPHEKVLHIHGHFEHPRNLVLTSSDYKERYGDTLDTLHGRFLWALLTFHPLLFIGFSLDDEYFQKMLTVIRADFRTGTSKPFHYGIFPYETSEDRERTASYVRSQGVAPIFYEVRGSDYSQLDQLINDFAEKLGISRMTNPVDAFNDDMLRRLNEN